MSQNDATFDATTNIRILVRELELSRERWTGYTDEDMHRIIRAIGYLRSQADQQEEVFMLQEQARAVKEQMAKQVNVMGQAKAGPYGVQVPSGPPAYPWGIGSPFYGTSFNGEPT